METAQTMIPIGTEVRWYSPKDRESLFGIVRQHLTASAPFTWHRIEVAVVSRFEYGGTRKGDHVCVPLNLLKAA